MAEVDGKLRLDAQVNRERLLDVARQALSADPKASLHAIAKAAGVGQGTLYRHFPTREALVLGVYRREVDDLVQLAPTLLAENAPLEAFREWCDRFVQYGRVKHGIADVVRAAMSAKDFQETYWPIVGAVELLMTACQRSGSIRLGGDAEDLTQLLGCLLHIPPTPEGEARTDRLLALVFRGLLACPE
jgi:AcrR family transcriptional regulator